MAGRTLLQQALPGHVRAEGRGLARRDARRPRRPGRAPRLDVAARRRGRARSPRSATTGRAVAAGSRRGSGSARRRCRGTRRAGASAELGAALAVAAGAMGKLALDLVLLAQTEVGGGRAPAPGGSSTLPHKQNPVGAVRARACAAARPAARRAPARRDGAGARARRRRLARGVGAAGAGARADRRRGGGRARGARRARGATRTRMRANLDATGGLLLGERVVLALAPAGRARGGEDRGPGRLGGRVAVRGRSATRCSPSPRSPRTSTPPRSTRCSTRPATSARRPRSSTRALARAPPGAAVTDLAHRLDGPPDAPVVVLSNSLGTDMTMWDPQLPALAERFRVVRYDTRGHGRVAGAGRRVHDRRARRRPARPARRAGDRARERRRRLARRHDRDGARGRGARARRPARAVLHLGPARPAGAVGGARRGRPRRRHGRDRGRDARPLVHARGRPGHGAPLRRDAARRPRAGLRGVLRARSATWTCASALPVDRRPGARDRRARGPRHAARARRRDRRRRSPARATSLVEDAAHLANVERAEEVTAAMLEHLAP